MSRQLLGDPACRGAFARFRRLIRSCFNRVLALPLVVVLAGALLSIMPTAPVQAACANPIVCENQLPGTPQSVWDVSDYSTTIQGFADPFSVNIGNSINFKIESPASSYKVDIYRMGYYGGTARA
jgi:hypothetical protein